jgi:hypothetical protein
MLTCSEACQKIKNVDKNVQRLESEENLPIISPRAPSTFKFKAVVKHLKVDDIV